MYSLLLGYIPIAPCRGSLYTRLYYASMRLHNTIAHLPVNVKGLLDRCTDVCDTARAVSHSCTVTRLPARLSSS